MANFTKAQMFDELRTIFLYEADHLALGAGLRMAEHFIGFVTERGEYLDEDPSRVDLVRFQIASTFDRAYDLAFNPSMLVNFGEHDLQDVTTFMEGTPRAGGIVSGGTRHAFMTADGLCQTVADTVSARWNLEFSEWQPPFTTRQLALLANMSEGAVRNAMADKTESGLRAVPGSKPVEVEFEEAKRWLKGRRGFMPSPRRLSDDRVVFSQLAAVRSAADLGQLIRQCILLEPPLQSQATLQANSEWTDGTFVFDAIVAHKLAVQLDLDAPLFVGKALEVSMRRDATAESLPRSRSP